MTKEDREKFIEAMKAIEEDWTHEEVEEQYGDCATLREAIDKRLGKINNFYNFVEEVVRPEAEQLGLWPRKDPDQPPLEH